MRRWAVTVTVLTGFLLLAGPPEAGAQSTTTTMAPVSAPVTVEPGPSRRASFVPRCSDVGIILDEQLSFVLRRTTDATVPLTVNYRLSGSAQPGVHYEPLPGSATLSAGSASATIPVVPRQTASGAVVDLTLELVGTAQPQRASITFISPPPAGPVECGYNFTSDPWNTEQRIAVGEGLHRLTLEEFSPPVLAPADGVFSLVGGALPPGITLQRDGSFTGAATTAGTFNARIQACRPVPPGTCITTGLTVVVTGAGILPRTGPPGWLNGGPSAAAILLVSGVLGVVLLRLRRFPAPPSG